MLMLTACAVDPGTASPSSDPSFAPQRNVDTFGSVLNPSASYAVNGYSRYIALGDSFSSANGVANDGPICFRGTGAWPYLLQPKLTLQDPSQPLVFAACSGASTQGILAAEQGMPPQIDSVKSLAAEELASALITITIGGNDSGVSTELLACIAGDCTQDESSILSSIAATRPKLVNTYTALKAAAPGATIVAVGYPHLVAETATTSCTDDPTADIDLAERAMIRRAVDVMNSTIASAAKEVGIYWITDEVVAAFEGREACAGTDDDFIWRLEIAALPSGPFHQTASGNRAYAEAVFKGLSARVPAPSASATAPAASAAKPGVAPTPGAKPGPASTTRTAAPNPGAASTPGSKPAPSTTPSRAAAGTPDSETMEGEEAPDSEADSETESDADAIGEEDEAQEDDASGSDDDAQDDASESDDDAQDDASESDDDAQDDASESDDDAQDDTSESDDDAQDDTSESDDDAQDDASESDDDAEEDYSDE